MKKIFSILAIAVLAVTGCKKSTSSAPANSANVMFVNGCAGTGSIYVMDGTTKIAGASNVAFFGTSGYQYITAGSQSLSFYVSSLGSSTPLNTLSTSFTANAHYSVFVAGLITGSSTLVTTDDLSAPTSGNANIRFINLSSDALSENVSVGTTSIATSVTSLQASAFASVGAGNFVIKAGDPSNISTVVSTASVTLSAGKIYTVMLTGTLACIGTSALTLTVLTNN